MCIKNVCVFFYTFRGGRFTAIAVDWQVLASNKFYDVLFVGTSKITLYFTAFYETVCGRNLLATLAKAVKYRKTYTGKYEPHPEAMIKGREGIL